MRPSSCGSCGQLVFHGNDRCLRCGSTLAFRPSTRQVVVPGPADVVCSTAATSGCTWLVEDGRADGRCGSCRAIVLVPPLDDPATAGRYREATADHRVLAAQLIGLGVPHDHVTLRLPSSRHAPEGVVTGHVDGVVTIDVEEADDVRRERERQRLDEPYRTFLGHLRHEYGHALREVLVTPADTDRVREAFGDERADYGAALERHYAQGPPQGWADTHVSAYATMHPHEDFAETFAHVLHVTSTLETADAFGLRVDPDAAAPLGLSPHAEPDPDLRDSSFRAALATFLPLSYALNAVTRAMGDGPLYPFALAGPVVEKLVLVAGLVERAGGDPRR